VRLRKVQDGCEETTIACIWVTDGCCVGFLMRHMVKCCCAIHVCPYDRRENGHARIAQQHLTSQQSTVESDDAFTTRERVFTLMPWSRCSKTYRSRVSWSGFSCPSGPGWIDFFLLFSIVRMGSSTSAACSCCHFTISECAT
jgi:hypothetical protein